LRRWSYAGYCWSQASQLAGFVAEPTAEQLHWRPLASYSHTTNVTQWRPGPGLTRDVLVLSCKLIGDLEEKDRA